MDIILNTPLHWYPKAKRMSSLSQLFLAKKLVKYNQKTRQFWSVLVKIGLLQKGVKMTKNVLQKVITPQTSDMSSHNIWQDLDQIKLRKSGGHFFCLGIPNGELWYGCWGNICILRSPEMYFLSNFNFYIAKTPS